MMLGKFLGYNAALVLALSSAAGYAANAPAAPKTTSAPSGSAPKPAKVPTVPTRQKLVDQARANFKVMDTNNDGYLSAEELNAQNKKMADAAITARQKRLDATFDRFDLNKDGQLSRAEFSAIYGQKIEPADGKASVEKMDTNHDVKVSLDEFVSAMTANFDRLDTNRDGTLSADELRKRAAK